MFTDSSGLLSTSNEANDSETTSEDAHEGSLLFFYGFSVERLVQECSKLRTSPFDTSY